MADDYEREHMPGIGQVLFRLKATAPRWAVVLVSAIPLAGGIIGATLGMTEGLALLPALGITAAGVVGTGLLSTLMVAFATGRVAVSEGEVHIQLGAAGPRIPIAAIRSVRIAPSGFNNYGLGVKRLLGGRVVFSLLGDNARAVWIEREGAPLVIVCKEPEALRAAIAEALERRDRGQRVRVELGAEDETDAVAAEPEAEEGSTAPQRTRRS